MCMIKYDLALCFIDFKAADALLKERAAGIYPSLREAETPLK